LFAFIASGCFQKCIKYFTALAVLSLMNNFYEPCFLLLCHRLLRRTLVLVNGEWSVVNKKIHFY